ncbi:MAG TPA: hypothetical protein PK528_00230 [Syntrophorhabdus sp.]|nr:hypothetical protein [Syntrophorhabdus sp.]
MLNLTIPFMISIICFMDVNEKLKKAVKQPDNMVYYRPRDELYSTLHTCVVLRELPELSPEELQQIAEWEQKSK